MNPAFRGNSQRSPSSPDVTWGERWNEVVCAFVASSSLTATQLHYRLRTVDRREKYRQRDIQHALQSKVLQRVTLGARLPYPLAIAGLEELGLTCPPIRW